MEVTRQEPVAPTSHWQASPAVHVVVSVQLLQTEPAVPHCVLTSLAMRTQEPETASEQHAPLQGWLDEHVVTHLPPEHELPAGQSACVVQPHAPLTQA